MPQILEPKNTPGVQAGFRKGTGTRNQIVSIQWVIEKAKGSWRKQVDIHTNIYFCFIDYTKNFDCVDHNKLWKILKEIGVQDHLPCLLRSLNAG